MMTVADVFADAFGRIQEDVRQVVSGLTADQLGYRPDSQANSIGWLIWHLTRVQDDHVAGVAGTEQVWTAGGWADRFGLPFPAADHGYGHDSQQVAAVRIAAPELLTGYHDAVCAVTLDFVRRLTDADLGRIVDTRWDPPVTLSVRMVSVICDDLQHVGQAAYLRGIIEGR